MERNDGTKNIPCMLWKAFGMEQFMRGMWEHPTVTRAWAKAVLAFAEKEKLKGIQGKWQEQSSFKEVLDQIKKRSDMSCTAYLMRSGVSRGKNMQLGRVSKGEISEWVFAKVKESRELFKNLSRIPG